MLLMYPGRAIVHEYRLLITSLIWLNMQILRLRVYTWQFAAAFVLAFRN